MNNHRTYLSLMLVGSLVTTSALGAQPAKKKAPAKQVQKTSALAGTQQKKRKTVAELLAQVKEESRGGKAEMHKTQTAIPQTDLGFQQQAPQRNLEQIKPPPSSVIFKREGGLKAEYEKVLDQQIDELFKLTRKFKDSGNRGEMWLRLAELYVEKAGIVDILKQEEYDKKLKAYQAGKTKVKPQLDVAAAREYNKKAIQLYEWFTRDFPNDPKIPQALFFLGYNHFELGNTKKGVEYYADLVKRFPQSPFVKEAEFALGEYYFENEQWSDAYKHYAQIIKEKNHSLHTFATYKGAWALYRMGKYEQALKYIEYIIKSGRAQADTEVAGKRAVNNSRLEGEALRDLVVFYAAVGSAEQAENYFSNLVPDDISPYMEKLANIYNDRGNKDASSLILSRLIEKNPTGPKAYNYQYQIVQNYFYAKNSARFKEELYRWIKDYDKKSQWYEVNRGNKELTENSEKLRETTLKKYALQQHQTAQNSRDPHAQSQANEAYLLYINTFGDSEAASDMHFYYGELLYDMKKYDEAAAQYNWVVQNAPQSKFFTKAAANLIHAVEKGVPSDKELAKRVGTSLEPLPLEPKVEKFIKAGQWYVKNFPNSDKAPEIQFRMGRLYYQSNHFDEANQMFSGIVQKYPKTKQAEYSANLMLDIFNLKKDYVGLEKAAADILKNEDIAKSKAGEDIRGVLEKASFKRAQDLEVQKDYAGSAAQFEAFAKQNPASSLALQAIFNAGVNNERAGQNYQALADYQQVIHAKTDNGGMKLKSKRLAAKLYQNSGQLEEAAKLFKQVAAEEPKDPLTPNLVFTAAALYEVLGRDSEAIKTYDEFIKMSKKHSDKMDAIFSIAQIQRKAGHKSAAARQYEEYISGGPDPQKMVEAHYWLYEMKNSEDWRKKTIAVFKRTPASKKKAVAHFAAKARMKDAEEAFGEYKRLKLAKNPANLKKSIDEKLFALKKFSKVISEIIEYDSGEEIVSGLTLLGQAYQNMGDTFVQAPLPPGLTAEEKKMYQEKVQKELADPQYAQAKESYRKAIEKAWALDAYPANYKHAVEYMSKVDPQNFYDGGEATMDSRMVNWMTK
jgi:TolA-binding protein